LDNPKIKTEASSRDKSLSLLATYKITRPVERKFITPLINDQPVRLQIDTASDITIVSQKTWSSLGKPRIQRMQQKVISACEGKLPLIGQLQCSVS
ncbi:hypothetical protein EWB00_009650, partial [Schistosoma japonicum]